MSFAASLALQKAVYGALSGDIALNDLVGGAVFDAVPPGDEPDLYVLLGPERVRDRSDVTAAGSLHDFTVAVVSEASGYSTAKRAAGLVFDLLTGTQPALERGQLVSLRFLNAVARRKSKGSAGRQVDLTFRARIDDI